MNKSMKYLVFLIIISGTLIITGAGEQTKMKDPQTVSGVDLKKYAGKWYEIAKIPNRFQKKCIGNTTAEYRVRTDGRIDVINRCDNTKGSVTTAKGIAKIVDTNTNAKLKVSFVKFLGIQLFWGDYWILGLDKDYQYAVVGDSERKYGWVLAREKELNGVQWSEIEKIFSEQGYDKEKFVKTTHSN